MMVLSGFRSNNFIKKTKVHIKDLRLYSFRAGWDLFKDHLDRFLHIKFVETQRECDVLKVTQQGLTIFPFYYIVHTGTCLVILVIYF